MTDPRSTESIQTEPRPSGSAQPPAPGPITEDMVEKHEARMAAREQAHATAIPGPLKQAFARGKLTVCGLTFRPVMLGDYQTLELIESPLLPWFNGMMMGEKAKLRASVPDIQDAIYLFTRPAEEAARLAEAEGPRGFRKAAAAALRKLPQSAIPKLIEAIVENYLASLSTAVAYEPEAAGEDGNFTQGHRPTDSAGG